MFNNKKTVDLKNLNQQELMIKLVESQLKTEKFTERILDSVLFWFYAGLIAVALYFLLSM